MMPVGRAPDRGAPGLPVVLLLLGTELLLIAFSVSAAMLAQPALAVMAGTAAITLAGEIVRRFLVSASAGDTRRDPES